MLLSNALSAATGLAIGHVLSNLLHSEAPTLNVEGHFLSLQKDAIALSNVILEPSTDAYKNASAAFKVGSEVFEVLGTTQQSKPFQHLPTDVSNTREVKDIAIVMREPRAPDAGIFFTKLQSFNVSLIEKRQQLPSADALVKYILSCIACFLSSKKNNTEKAWRASFELLDNSDERMWKAWTDYYDQNKYVRIPPSGI